jgi:hypothetical protein
MDNKQKIGLLWTKTWSIFSKSPYDKHCSDVIVNIQSMIDGCRQVLTALMGGGIKVYLKSEIEKRMREELRHNKEEIKVVMKHLKQVGSLKVHKIKIFDSVHKVNVSYSQILKMFDCKNQGNVDGFDCFWISTHQSLALVE